jgi:hypothetical protein
MHVPSQDPRIPGSQHPARIERKEYRPRRSTFRLEEYLALHLDSARGHDPDPVEQDDGDIDEGKRRASVVRPCGWRGWATPNQVATTDRFMHYLTQ